MSLFLRADDFDARRDAAAGPLQPLAASLAADLAIVAARDLYIPDQKALLSRDGGRCARDGTLLEFDPFQPHEHRCPVCGQRYTGEFHDRFWIYWYQLWLAERAVHAAALYALGVDTSFATLAARILDGYVDCYDSYPNVDNVLGPTRLFFSTYIESIWLLQVAAATSLLGAADAPLVGRVKDRILEPSRAIIAEYDEGASNRQVWNAVAQLAAARLLGDEQGAERAVFGDSGIVFHLANGLLPDGTWYEGENYHLFAHRGLWYGVTMAERAGMELPLHLVERFQLGFTTPFLTALPDFTLPSRRDSQYAISLRQWRIAEHTELGFARASDAVLGGALARLYEDDVPRRTTNRATSSADAERNGPASLLSRADLSWRALLCARPELPALERVAPRSALLDAQGIAVFRRDSGQAYVALDYGHSGGGHGHPDRLNLLLVRGSTRWLDDYGTGSYVDPSLHWYRSTLAHNAPLVDGTSQRRVDGRLVAFDERGAAGWVSAAVDGIAPGVTVERTIVVMPEYLIEEVRWQAERIVSVDLPFHSEIVFDRGVGPSIESSLTGGTGTEDGFRFARDTSVQHATAGEVVYGVASTQHGEQVELWTWSDHAAEWWTATAPAAPGAHDRAFRFVRAQGSEGAYRSVIAWSKDVVAAAWADGVQITLMDGARHVHRRTAGGWQVELHAGDARSSIDLGGVVSRAGIAAASTSAARAAGAIELVAGMPTVIELGEPQYRRSESSWSLAGAPAAWVTMRWTGHALNLEIGVVRSDLSFAPADALNRYDNENADINGDGVQLYIDSAAGRVAWMLVPDAGSSSVRTRLLEGWGGAAQVAASWRREGDGYRITADVSDIVPTAIDVVINEMPRGRERRRGQLVLSGGAGQFVYLQGDRHDVDRLIPLRIRDV